jgi:hypothetical protein
MRILGLRMNRGLVVLLLIVIILSQFFENASRHTMNEESIHHKSHATT